MRLRLNELKALGCKFDDYGSEGWSFKDETYDSLDEAVKEAIQSGANFKIVQVIDWMAAPTGQAD